MYRALTTAWKLSSFLKNICGQNINLLWSLDEKGGIGGEGSSSHTIFLTRCLIKLTFLCHGHPRRGPVLLHSPLEGSGGAVMNSNTICNGKRTIATLWWWQEWILSFCHEWQRYWDHVWRWGVTDICHDGSDICIPDWVAIRSNRYLPWW